MLIPSLRITNPLTQRSLPPLLGYCSFFPFPTLEIIKSLVGTKEKSFFEHSSPKKASGVSSRKKTTIFPRDSKKQATIALSTTEAEYVAATGCSTQMLWMRSQLEDYQI